MEKGRKVPRSGLVAVGPAHLARSAFRLASGYAVTEREIQHQEPPQHTGDCLLQSPSSHFPHLCDICDI